MTDSDTRVVTVFGGTGFLGRRIVRHLLAEGFVVRVAARHPERFRKDAAEGGDRARPIRADIGSDRAVAAALEGAYGSYGGTWVMTVCEGRRIEAGVEPARTSEGERYAMTTNSTVVSFEHPDALDDPLTSVLRDGARRLLAEAVEAEAEAFLAAMQDERLADGRARLVRHGHGPERTVQTGIGPVPVRRVKLRDRGADEATPTGDERIVFTSAILPKWSRRTKSLDALLPVLYLRGISTGDFQEALGALLGKDAPNLSPTVIGRLKEEWQAEYDRWQRRDLAARHYVYIWVDGIYLQARMEDDAACMLVIVGATPEGRKELVGFQVGVRESAQKLARAPRRSEGPGAIRRAGDRRRRRRHGLLEGARGRSSPRPDISDAGCTSSRMC